MAYSAEAILLEEWAEESIEKADLNNVAEDKLSDFVTQTVPDSTFSPNTTNRAKKSLPKKLILKPTNATHNSTEVGVWAQKHIPKGTRFGPIVGEIKPVKGDSDSSNFFMVGDVKIVTEDVNKTFIWNVFSKAASKVPTVIDVGDILKSNWIRYVQFAESKAAQNLVAYQNGCDIYFLATRDIQKDEELAVWYCKEFAARVDKPESPLEWRETRAATANVEISIKISDKQSEEEESVRDNESDSGYTGSPVCDQNESDENSYSENKHDSSKSCNENSSSSEHLPDSDENWHAQTSGENHLDLNIEITPGSKFIKLRGKSFSKSIFYCLLCKSGTGLFMGVGDLVHHFQVTCKTCDNTFHGFQDFMEHMSSTHEKIPSNQVHHLFDEWSKDFMEEVYGLKVPDTKVSVVHIKTSDVDTKVVDVHAKAFDTDTKASDVDTKWYDADSKASDVDIKASDEDTKASNVYTKEAHVSAKESAVSLSKLNLQEILPSRLVIEKTDNVEYASIDDSEASRNCSLLTHENVDEEAKRNQDEEIKRSDLIMDNMKMNRHRQEVDIKASHVYTKEADVRAKESAVNLSKLNLQEIPPSRVEYASIDDSDASRSSSLTHGNMDALGKRNQDEIKRSDLIMRNIKLGRNRQEVDGREKTGNVDYASIDDSEANRSRFLMAHENMDEDVKRNQDEEIKSDLIMHNIKMNHYRQEINGLQQSHMEKDNMIKGKVEELKNCCQLSSIDCQNVNAVYEQTIEALQKGEMDKDALFTKLDSIQKGVTSHAKVTNVENGDSVERQVNEMKKERKREKAAKPYCARAACPNKGRHRCSRCKAVFYCREDCLTQDWPHHKTFCNYVYEANKCPQDSNKKDAPETEESGSREEVD